MAAVDFRPLFQNLEGLGYTPAATSGILGNFGQESGLNPAIMGDSGTSGGLGQWHNERLTNLKNFAAQQGQDWRSPLVQLGFANQEIRADPRLFNALQAAKSPGQAADIFSSRFERPNPAYANNPRREALAEQAFENQGQGPTRALAASLAAQTTTNEPPASSPAPASSVAPPQSSPWADLASGLANAVPALMSRASQQQRPPQLPEAPIQPQVDPRALAASITAGLPGNLVLT